MHSAIFHFLTRSLHLTLVNFELKYPQRKLALLKTRFLENTFHFQFIFKNVHKKTVSKLVCSDIFNEKPVLS